MDEKFPLNLLRMIAAEMHFQSVLAASREMFGRGYFSLGVVEKAAVEQTVLGHIAGNYGGLTPEYLQDQQAKQPMGFPIHTPPPTPGSSSP